MEKQEDELKEQLSKVSERQRHGNIHSRPSDEDRRSKLDHISTEGMRRIKSLKIKKDTVIRTIEDRAEEIERKVKEIRWVDVFLDVI